MIEKLKQHARVLQSETYALYLAARDPCTPWYAKLLVAGIVAYAFSPIDLIPDFVPMLGYLDDLILLPMGIALAIKLVPDPVLEDCRSRAQEALKNGKPVSRIGRCRDSADMDTFDFPVRDLYRILRSTCFRGTKAAWCPRGRFQPVFDNC